MNLTIISGGSSGLGFELAKLFAMQNEPILILGKTLQKVENALRELKKFTTSDVFGFALDLSKESEYSNLKNFLLHKNYTIKLLINNAGSVARCNVFNLNEEILMKALKDNCVSMALLTSACLKYFNNKPCNGKSNGMIVNIMSSASLKGNANESAYCMAKWGAKGFTLALKEELKAYNINVMAVYPSGMQTPFWDKEIQPSFNKFMKAEEVAEIIYNSIKLSNQSGIVGELVIEKNF